MSQNAGRVGVLIPHAGNPGVLSDCLNSLTSDLISRVYVVIPSHSRESADLVRAHPSGHPIQTPSTLSFAEATNLSAQYATEEFLFLLNDDTRVHPGALERLISAMEDEGVAIAAPRLLNVDGGLQPSVYDDPSWRTFCEVALQPITARISATKRKRTRRWLRFPYSHLDGTSRSVWVSGAAMLVRRATWDRVGGLDEAFPHGIEDAALCRRVRELEFQVLVVPEASVTHLGGTSGFRHATDPHRVAHALDSGRRGWLIYWSQYRSSSAFSMIALRLCFSVMAATRLLGFGLLLAFKSKDQSTRVRFDAYGEYLPTTFQP